MKLFARILFLVLVSFWSTSAFAATPAETQVENATVNIYCSFKSGHKIYSSTGSGVFVSDRGVVLTNAHVAQTLLALQDPKAHGSCSIRTGSPAKEAYTVSLLYLSPAWVDANIAELRKKHPKGSGEGDFALLYVTIPKSGALPIRFPALPLDPTPVAEGQTVIAGGYPAGALDFEEVKDELKFALATPVVTSVRSYVKPWPDVVLLSPSVIGSGGVSGGPVTDTSGELLGIMTAVESDSSKKERSVRAISLYHIIRLLAENHTSLSEIANGDLASRSAATLAEFSSNDVKAVKDALLRVR